MSVFVVISPIQSNPKLRAAIMAKYPSNHYELHENQWLINSATTSREVSENLDINNDDKSLYTGPAVVFAISSYWGRANTELWEWLKVNLEKNG